MTTISKHKCPTCTGFIPNNEAIGLYPGAISRKDNKTEICSACGTREALEAYALLRFPCNCNELDDDLLAQGHTCYECYINRKDNAENVGR